MPIYEYRCDDCGHELEALQKISDPLLTDCHACQTPSLKKIMSAAGFRLKGGGWYETDFKSGADKKKNLVESGAESKSESKAESKSETKAESKPETKAESKSETKKTETKSAKSSDTKAA
jgi:putative FmdB family regulatory protein